MSTPYENAAALLFPFIVASSCLAIWRAKHLLKAVQSNNTLENMARKPGKTWHDVVGVLAFLFVLGPFFVMVPKAVFVFLAIFLILAAVIAIRYDLSRWYLNSIIPSGFTGLALLLYGFYELQLFEWEKTIASPPSRVDLLVVGPFLYLAVARTWRYWETLRRVGEAPRK